MSQVDLIGANPFKELTAYIHWFKTGFLTLRLMNEFSLLKNFLDLIAYWGTSVISIMSKKSVPLLKIS